ncbi:MAG: YceI family protein [Verrucomicrobia bacterium]|nr:YceI family protein [Verrucomicrobiota bacterium]MCH8511901.1 YceI family protein [Kiritimatiellia bacterium]
MTTYAAPSFSDLTPDELHVQRQTKTRLVVLDVLPPEAHDRVHLPGARNACVYAVAFPEQVSELIPDKTTPIVVYGQSDDTLEGKMAVEKLHAAGYTRVSRMIGGLTAWRAAGFPVEEAPPQPTAPGTSVCPLDVDASVIFWTGSNRFNHHTGTLALSEGFLAITEGEPSGGEFILDMDSIACTDLTDPAMNAMLVAHLRHDDFFAVDRFPTARFKLQTARRLEGSTDGTPTHRLSGDFTLRGITAPIDFKASLHPRPEGGWGLQAHFAIDRTRWKVLYGSGRFFAKLGQHLVNDAIHLHLKLFANPPS